MGKSRDTEAEKPGQHIGCGNNHFGCGKSMRIVKYHNQVEMVEADGYSPAVHLCITCCNQVARDWQCDFPVLPYLMTAVQYCKAGACGVPPKFDAVWDAMGKMGIKKSIRYVGVSSFTDFKKHVDTQAEKDYADKMIKEAIRIYT